MEQAGEQVYQLFFGPSLVAPYAAAVVDFTPSFSQPLPVARLQSEMRALTPAEIELPIAWPGGPLQVADFAALIANAFQDLRGPAFLPHVVSDLGGGRLRITAGFFDPDAAVMALRAGLGLAHAVFAKTMGRTGIDRTRLGMFLKQSAVMSSYQPDSVTRAIMRASSKRGIPLMPLVPGSGMWFYGEGVHGFQFAESSNHRDSQIGLRLSLDKFRCGEFLRSLGLPSAEHLPVTSAQQAIQVARRYGYPVVVKPVRGSKGRGVSVGVKDDAGVAEAFAKAFTDPNVPVLVERLVPGDDFRLSVFGGKLLRASRFDPPHVIGDGVSDISRLVEKENDSRNKDDIAAGLMIRVTPDSEMVATLREQGFELADIPPAGARVWLRRNANLATGGTLEEVTDSLHPDNRIMAETIARAFHLDAVGIDFMTTDATRSWRDVDAAVIEVNATPGLSDILAERLIAQKFPGNGRVPAVLLVGNAPEAAKKISEHLLRQGLCVGETGPDATRLNGEQRFRIEPQLPARIRALLLDPACEVLVVQALPNEIEQHGLPYAKFGLAILGDAVISKELEHLLANNVSKVLSANVPVEDILTCVDRLFGQAMRDGPNHWQTYHHQWNTLEAPLRPNSEIIARVVNLVGEKSDRILLLGVTPELALSFENVVAVDNSASMIANVWPGDGAKRRAIKHDWLELDGSLGKFSAVIGDGSCNAVAFGNDLKQVLRNIRDHLESGGRFVCRLYMRPEKLWSWEELLAEAARPAKVNFHAFKWKIAMRIAADSEPSVRVEHIVDRFDYYFPDRDEMAAATGWVRPLIDTIDRYRASPAIYCFPTKSEFLGCIPSGFRDSAFHASGTYHLAEDCPIFTSTRN